VITNEAAHTKCILFHPRMLPGQVIADPELTLGLPRTLTVWTGFDALSHNLEALCAPGFHPLADGIATEGIRLVHGWLRAAALEGANLTARAAMLAAASMGATAFQKGLGAMHALAHPIGGLLDSQHGLTIAIVMPYVLTRNLPAIEARLIQLERTLGMEPGGFRAWVSDLRQELGVPPTLAALGLREEQVDLLAPRAAADPSAAGNPIALSAGDYAALYRQALAG
jgi:alcohol dehydrogenase class IV